MDLLINTSRVEIIIDGIGLNPNLSRRHIGFFAELEDIDDEKRLNELITEVLLKKSNKELKKGLCLGKKIRRIDIFIDRGIHAYKYEKSIGFSTVIKDVNNDEKLQKIISSALFITKRKTVKDNDIF